MNLKFEKYCCYCGKSLNILDMDYTKEHLVPKSKGGNNLKINKITCCKKCNNWRGDQQLEQFRVHIQYHLNNKIIEKGYTLYDYEIMLENIDYWIGFIGSDKKKFKR